MTGKQITGLDCEAPADQMIQLVLLTQLKAMCALRKKALDWSDPEGVHDMRVRSRRFRTAIVDFQPYLRKPRLPLTKLRSIAKSLGGVRDHDVALIALEKLKTNLQGEVAEGIEMLAAERRLRREDARADLRKAIKRSAVAEFREEFKSKLSSLTLRSEGANLPSFSSIGSGVIAARMKELRTASPHIFFPSQNRELHELRIMGKRLRYAVELFESCWGEQLKASAKEIALLQTSLGELHDCDVWIDDLGDRLRKAARKRQTEPDQLSVNAACAWLLKHFVKERTEHYRAALSRWQDWEANGLLRQLEAIIASPK